MSMLDRKLGRDLRQMGTQAVAIGLVMACGIAMFTMALYSLESLRGSQQDYYRRYRFADVFGTAVRVPNEILPRLQQISGVSQVEGRIVGAALLDMPDMEEPVTARLISWPDDGQPLLNNVFVSAGRVVDPNRDDEVMASQSFVEAHDLSVGDELTFMMNGRQVTLYLVGVVYSPEYIVQIQPGSLLPDYRRFGVFWAGRRHLAAAYDMEGAFNDVTLRLTDEANPSAVIDALDQALEVYGGTGAIGREHHVSHRFLEDEIKQLTMMAWVAPTIFLLVAAFLLNVMIARVVALQREQVAILKACGFTGWQIGLHYLKLAWMIGGGGALLGLWLGYLLGQNTTAMYSEVYRFPVRQAGLQPTVIWGSLLISLGSATIGTWRSIRTVMKLPPAEAMRPATPTHFRAGWLEYSGVKGMLPQVGRMLLRQLQRQPMKALTTIFGISMGLGIMILGSFSLDAIRYLVWFQFSLSQRQDMSVVFTEAIQDDVIDDLGRLPGVMQIQSFQALPMELKFAHAHRKVTVLALGTETSLYRLVDRNETPVATRREGIVLSDKLAEILDVQLGDKIWAQSLEGQRQSHWVEVTGLVNEYGGLNAYMSPVTLREWTHLPATCSGVHLKVDANQLSDLYQTLKGMPKIASVNVKGAAMRSFEETFAENILKMRTFNVIFTVVIAFGVIYNHARISLAEQSRDLATLRVMGFTHGEVTTILLGELAILTAMAVPLGCAFGYLLAWSLVWGMETEMYRIPLVIQPTTFGFAIVVVVISAFVSGLVMLRKIRALDLVGVLKARE